MDIKAAKLRMERISVEMESVYTIQSIEEVARKRCLLSARLIDMTLLFEGYLRMLPDAKASLKHDAALKEMECRGEGSTVSDAKAKAYIHVYEMDLRHSMIEHEAKIVAAYMEAIKKNLDALAGLQRALETEKYQVNLKTQ